MSMSKAATTPLTKKSLKSSLLSDIRIKALSPRYDGSMIPYRYEETQPVQLQSTTHTNILDIGANIHTDIVSRSLKDKEDAVKESENLIWKKAERMKEEAVEKCRRQAQAEQEKALKELKKVHEKSMKEEILRIENEMQKLVVAEKKRGEKRSEELVKGAVEETKLGWQEDVKREVAIVREEERNNLKIQTDKLTREASEKLKAAVEKVEAKRKKEVKEQREELLSEREVALVEAVRKERELLANEIASLHHTYAEQINFLEKQIRAQYEHTQKIYSEMEQAKLDKEEAEKQYQITKKEFQNYINRTQGLLVGQADFLLPDY